MKIYIFIRFWHFNMIHLLSLWSFFPDKRSSLNPSEQVLYMHTYVYIYIIHTHVYINVYINMQFCIDMYEYFGRGTSCVYKFEITCVYARMYLNNFISMYKHVHLYKVYKCVCIFHLGQGSLRESSYSNHLILYW